MKYFIALLLILTFSVYFWLRKRKTYWLKRNVPTAMETLFFLGRTQHIALFLEDIYKRFKNSKQPFVGCFFLFSPAILLIDLDLIKRVFINDFESFPDRGFYHNIRDDPLSSNLTRLQGEAWRRLRSKMTPTFTSGKMKYMFPTELKIGERLVSTLRNLIQMGQHENEIEIRDLCARFTTDVIGSVAFGIDCNSLAEPKTKFRILGEKGFQCYRPVLEHLAAKYPKFFQRLHVTAFTQELIDFYTKIVKDTLAMRELKNIRRNDFLDILIELQKTPTDDGVPMLTLEEIIGQVFVFFIGGYETSSSTMTYCLYELSKNLEIQQRVRTEVHETLKRFNGVMSYDCIKEMNYLEQTVQETLRIHPVAPLLRRIVRKRYQIPDTTIYLEEGVQVLIPVSAIHHDPEYYPTPEKFDPEHFSAEALRNRHSMTYLPFGAGPRVCIAERFGKMEVQLGVALLLKHFKFSASAKTPKVLQYDVGEKRIFKVKELFLNVEII